jgi:hypothetical protein
MSNEHKRSAGSEKLGFEREDLSAAGVITFLLGLAVIGILVHLTLTESMKFADNYMHRHETTKSPMVAPSPDTRAVLKSDIEKFPQPRLETDERTEVFAPRLSEEQQLNSYGWVDPKAGIAHIPIERAMEMIAQQGLPTTPKVGTAPPSEVNMVRQAAARSDASGGATGLEKTGMAQSSTDTQQKGRK